MYNFIGDIHGKVWAVEAALALEGHIVFVGDINDSFEYHSSEHGKCFDLILDAIEEGKATCLYGNHELSYMHDHMICSGYKKGNKKEQEKRQDRLNKLFKNYLWLEETND